MLQLGKREMEIEREKARERERESERGESLLSFLSLSLFSIWQLSLHLPAVLHQAVANLHNYIQYTVYTVQVRME